MHSCTDALKYGQLVALSTSLLVSLIILSLSMFLPKTKCEALKETLNAIDKASRKKGLSGEDTAKVHADAIKALRSILSVLRTLK